MLRRENVVLDDFYYCPHKPEDNCACRKPSPKMIIDASKNSDIDLQKSFMIGDKSIDIESGINAGCKTVLLMNNKLEDTTSIKPDFIARNWWEIAEYIFMESKYE